MRIVNFITFLVFFSQAASCQYIFEYYEAADDLFNLIYLNNGQHVFVNGTNKKNFILTTVEYYKQNNEINKITHDYISMDSLISVPMSDTKDFTPMLYHYPPLIKAKNSNFTVSFYSDSLVYTDSINENQVNYVSKIKKDTTKIYYLNPSKVLINNVSEFNKELKNEIHLYYLDGQGYLKTVESSHLDIDHSFTLDDTLSIAKSEKYVFLYNKKNSRIDSIQKWIMWPDHWVLFNTQTFFYKKRKPIRSEFYDHRKKEIKFWIKYQYGKIGDNPKEQS